MPSPILLPWLTSTAAATAFSIYIAGRTSRTAEAFALVALIAGVIPLLALVTAQHLHHVPTKMFFAWGLGMFALCEIVAIRAAYEARATRIGKWALGSAAWPLVLLAVLFVGRWVKSVFDGM